MNASTFSFANAAFAKFFEVSLYLSLTLAACVTVFNIFIDRSPVYEHRWVVGPFDAIPDDTGPVADSTGSRYRTGKLRDQYKAGDIFIYKRNVCVFRHKAGTVIRTMIRLSDDREITFTPTTWTADKAPCSPPDVVKAVTVPSDFLPSKYEMKFHVIIPVNAERTFEEDIPSIFFEVVK